MGDASKYVFDFEESSTKIRHKVGNKGANLGEMVNIGLSIPPGFTVTTEACEEYLSKGELPKGLKEEVAEHIRTLERKTNKSFGGKNPLLVSVRSGAAVSMPGMMDTVLNLGLIDSTVKEISEMTGDERFTYDVYRRFIQMFSSIVLGLDGELFDEKLTELKRSKGVRSDTELGAEDLKNLVGKYQEIVHSAGKTFPMDPYEQLYAGIKAVFDSWNGKRAVAYRKQYNITPDMARGTAVTVQTMVFGNMGSDCATGVAFTRNPGTGAKEFYGEYLTNAQGEDVVAGIRTPVPLGNLKDEMPGIYEELEGVRKTLEEHYREVQDLEFTVEKGRLYILQTRNGKMNARAMLKTSVDMCNEGLITKERAVLRMSPELLEQLFHPQIDPKARVVEREGQTWLVVDDKRFRRLGSGLAASPGAATGIAVFSADDAEAQKEKAARVILVREETKPDDIHGFFASTGILTARGGMTSHAAVVARGMGKPCVSGLEAMTIDERSRFFRLGTVVVKEGDKITVDGTTGSIYLGTLPLVDSDIIRVLTGKIKSDESEVYGEYEQLTKWVDEFRRLGVRANTDTPEGAIKARRFGAEGIGLCRTERMFNAADRLPIVRNMIMAATKEERQRYLDQLLPLQKKDFVEIVKAMEGLPVTIRLLDPPLHEFLPRIDEVMTEIQELEAKGADQKLVDEKKRVLDIVKNLWESNPMLGHRGVRLGITNPEIYEMQIRAILMAVVELKSRGVDADVEIMVPNVGSLEELRFVKENIIDKVVAELGASVPFAFGTMTEIVRSCLNADKIAELAEFFSFGTNDLTQGTFSFSRDDAEKKFLHPYLNAGVLKDNPFAVLDRESVGELMKIAVERGRKTRPDLKVGICGEHGGEPSSVEFCHSAGLDYVSCSPYRVPIAKLAAAHGALKS